MRSDDVAERVIRLSDRPVVAVKLGEEERAVTSDDEAVAAARDALDAEGYELGELREEPYRESGTWVVPVATEGGDRINVHVEATTGDVRLAHLR